MPLKYKYPRTYIAYRGRRATIPIDLDDIRSQENEGFKPLINYWLKKPLLGFYLFFSKKEDSLGNTIHKIPMVNYTNAQQKIVQAEWDNVDLPIGEYTIFTTVQPIALSNEYIVIHKDYLKIV